MRWLRRIVVWVVGLCIIGVSWSLGTFSEIQTSFVRNRAFLTLNRGWSEVCFGESIPKERRIQLFGELQDLGHVWLETDSEKHLLTLPMEPWVVITNTQQVEAEDPRWKGNTGHNLLASNHLVLYTIGGVEIPILLDETATVTISVHGRHAAPAPVILRVSVDDILVGDLLFKRGDNSWGVEALATMIPGGCHRVKVWYINDFFDKERQIDRNAYIDWVEIKKVQSE